MKSLKRMSILMLLLVITFLFFQGDYSAFAKENIEEDKVTIYFFWGEKCPHCATQKPYLEEWEERYGDKIEVKSYETWKNSVNALLFREVAQAHGIQARGVPTTFIGEKNWVGFSPSIAPEIEEYIKYCIDSGCEDLAKEGFEGNKSSDNKENELCIHVFLDENCTQCQSVDNYLKDLDKKYEIGIERYDVNDEEDKELFQQFKKDYGLKVDFYPTIFIGSKYLIGEEPIKTALEGEIERCLNEGCPCPLSKVKPFTPITGKPKDVTADESQTINLFSKDINVGNMPLIFSTLVISFIDGFNPCSLWVITFLLGIVILTGSRKKILAIGFTYLIVAGAAYGAFILGMISVFSYVGYLIWIRVLVALIATIFALVNIKDFFWYKKGISFTIPDSYKPKMFKKVRNIMRPDNKLRTLIIGSAIMALGITLVELPCTAGFPMLWSNIVAAQNVNFSFFIVLFSLYMISYFSIELVIFLSVVFTLRTSRFEEKHGRLLKLIGGVIMLILAIVLVFNPDLLNDIGTTILLFAGAIGLSILIAWIYSKEKIFEDEEAKLKSKHNDKIKEILEDEEKDLIKEVKEDKKDEGREKDLIKEVKEDKKDENLKKEEIEKDERNKNIKKGENIEINEEENKNE
jgi:thiol-disulfide isomerase/thioredoxin